MSDDRSVLHELEKTLREMDDEHNFGFEPSSPRWDAALFLLLSIWGGCDTMAISKTLGFEFLRCRMFGLRALGARIWPKADMKVKVPVERYAADDSSMQFTLDVMVIAGDVLVTDDERYASADRARGQRWTDEQFAELERRWKAGQTASVIAAAMGTTKGKISGILWRRKLSRDERINMTNRSGKGRPRPRPRAGPPAKPQTEAPEPVKRAEGTSAPRVPLLSLRASHCRWPLGDPSADDFGFCGVHRAQGHTYCQAHEAIAFVPSKMRRAEAHA